MAPIHGDTVLRALTFLLFMCFLITELLGVLSYTREELLVLQPSGSEVSKELLLSLNSIKNFLSLPVNSTNDEGPSSTRYQRRRGRRRGKRGGALLRLRKRNHKPPLPSIFLGNVRSLRHKIDELCCLIHTRKDYRDCSLFCFTETWLNSSVPDSAVVPPGFNLFRSDREFTEVDKSTGGGLCFLLNDEWCTDAKILSHSCTPELETLFIKCRPFYLPREFGSILLCATYVPPDANAKSAIDQLSRIITHHENKNPGSISIVLGDFNHTILKKGLHMFYQHVSCATRLVNTIDHCYTTIKGAYRSLKRAPLGNSDHNMVHLIPTYRQQLKREKPTVNTVSQWTDAATERLQGCFACTDWDMFIESSADLDECTDVTME